MHVLACPINAHKPFLARQSALTLASIISRSRRAVVLRLRDEGGYDASLAPAIVLDAARERALKLRGAAQIFCSGSRSGCASL
jgi:hypothetical protein